MLPETPSIPAAPDPLDSDPGCLPARLISIDSVNPDLVPGGAAETVIADFFGQWPAARGFEVRSLERRPGRPALVSIARGTGGGPLPHAQRPPRHGQPRLLRRRPARWTDCALLARAGIPCPLFGVDGAGAHAATEYVDLASLDRLTDILTDTIADFCS
ncbi:hypothetical protein ACFXKX_32765 [Streptomyces scopuliridis]|uniref:hypothetical protein n=1 Tax=Streptomyces scopuliridis TaxID=452529 RepID=UPI0036BE0AA5